MNTKDLVFRMLAHKFNISFMPVVVTDGMVELMKDFYSREEAWLLVLMPLMPVSAKTVARLQFKNPAKVEKMLQDMVNRGLLIEFTDDGVQKFQMAPFIPGVVEMTLMKGEDTPESRRYAKKMHDLLEDSNSRVLDKIEAMGSSFARVIPVNQGLSHENQTLPYEDVRIHHQRSEEVRDNALSLPDPEIPGGREGLRCSAGCVHVSGFCRGFPHSGRYWAGGRPEDNAPEARSCGRAQPCPHVRQFPKRVHLRVQLLRMLLWDPDGNDEDGQEDTCDQVLLHRRVGQQDLHGLREMQSSLPGKCSHASEQGDDLLRGTMPWLRRVHRDVSGEGAASRAAR